MPTAILGIAVCLFYNSNSIYPSMLLFFSPRLHDCAFLNRKWQYFPLRENSRSNEGWDRKHVVAETMNRAFGLVFSLYHIAWAAPAKVYIGTNSQLSISVWFDLDNGADVIWVNTYEKNRIRQLLNERLSDSMWNITIVVQRIRTCSDSWNWNCQTHTL